MTVLWPSVTGAFPAFSRMFEGYVLSMYLDVKGLVTCGVGNLIDPLPAALALPWKRDDNGQAASPEDVENAWRLLKSLPAYEHRSVAAARSLTGLHLDAADVDALVLNRLAENADYLAAHWFPQMVIWPADAQLAAMSLAWAVGPGWPMPAHYPTLAKACLAGDWEFAETCCSMRTAGNPGVAPRNRAQIACFSNAAAVVRAQGTGPLGDPSVLHYPAILTTIA